MKKIFLSLLVVATLCACSKNEGPNTDDKSVMITLSAGVPTAAMQNKASVESGNFPASVGGWETKDAVDYTATPWVSTATIAVNPSATSITLIPARTYNADGDVKTYMKAWYPAGTLANGVVSFDNDNATVDVLLAAEVYGSKTNKDSKTLEFKHKTTQLKFMVIKGTGLADGTKITNIEIINAQMPNTIDLINHSVGYKVAANLRVPGIDGNLVIGTTPAGDVAGDAVMIKPMTGNKLSLNITTNHASYDGVEAIITGDTDFLEGKAYTIGLTFGQSSLALETKVVAWVTGTGSRSFE